jgi:hypothetical protein
MRDVRLDIVSLAYEYEGVDCNTEEGLEKMAFLLGPPPKGTTWEPFLKVPFRIHNGKVQGISTCGLVAEGFWRLAGINMPALYEPYKIGRAISRAISFAKRHKAFLFGYKGLTRGDYVIFYGGRHVGTALTSVKEGDEEVVTMDGGQVCLPKSLQCIKERTRNIDSIYGYIDVSKLPLLEGDITDIYDD